MEEKDFQPLIQAGEKLLSETYAQPVKLLNPQKLDSPHTVLRLHLDPAMDEHIISVILKQVTTTKFNTLNQASSESQRLLNEWASLEFLAGLEGDNRFGPRLLAGDRHHNLVILEDLGERRTVMDLLYGDSREEAVQGLTAIGRLLGEMHAATHDRASDFAAIQARLGTESPLSDSSIDFRKRRDIFEDCFEELDFSPAPGFFEAVARLEGKLHTPGPFFTFAHCDAGPHNFLVLEDQVQLIDFEFGAYLHGFLDMVSARLGFPHAFKSQLVPLEHVRKLESAYQEALSRSMPEAQDDQLFQQAVAQAAAHWALSRWQGFWKGHMKEWLEIGEKAMGQKYNLPRERAQIFRAKVYMYLRVFVETAEEFHQEPEIKDTVASFMAVMKQKWPDLRLPEVYPVFR